MPLLPGDFAPHFRVASSVNPEFCFDTVAGRYVVLSFFGSRGIPAAERFLTEIVNRGARFDVTNAIFFGVTTDPHDVDGIVQQDPGRIYFYDLDLAVSKRFGLIEPDDGHAAPSAAADAARGIAYKPTTFVLDQSLRVVAILGMDGDATKHVDTIFSVLDSLPPLRSLAMPAPVLIVPYVFEPELCRTLIDFYETNGGVDSGFMRDVGGKTVGITDYSRKRRMDCDIEDEALIRVTQERISRRVVPAIRQAYQFKVTRIERHTVACYDAAQGAHFKAHRDNTTLGTAHRRFAVTLNLNSSEYEGGEIWFPEFGPKKYKPASGAAIVFSCSLLHEVPPVTRGKRYAFLPFLYDDAAAALRARNREHLGDISGATGGKPQQCDATPDAQAPAGNPKAPVIDGTRGCGNPDGCGTCLSAAPYELGTPFSAPSPPGGASAANV